ncbi:MAG: rubredoxin [Clostridium sp.]|nr:rubredoxin [Clostridium sp.]
MWGNIAIAFILAFIISLMITPYTIKIADKIGAVDVPKDQRRMHNRSMPKFGGPAVIIGFLISVIYLLSVMSIEGSIDLFGPEKYGFKLIGVFLGIVVITITGILDDIKTLKPIQKLIGQLVAATIIVSFGIQIEHLKIPFLYKVGLSDAFSVIITVLWIVGVTNAINLIDGLDGLSSGISMISCLSLLIIFALNGSPIIAIILTTALAGALVGFLPYNFAPAKTFIGDTGSNFLGFILAVISILGVAKTYTAVVIVLPVIVLGLPIFDVIWAIIRRIIKGKSLKAVFQADKGHLHHRLVAKGFSQKQAVLILYGISAAFGIFAVILFDSGIWKALSFLLMIIAAVAIGYKNFIKDKIEDNSMYECIECKYIYNPKYGNEKAGIAPGTEFKNLPDDWVCPVCGEGKDMFEEHEKY